MATRLVFLGVALAIGGALGWAYSHDNTLRSNLHSINLGDTSDFVRAQLGDPTEQRACGLQTLAPNNCDEEYVYRYWFSVFRRQYEVVWFDKAGKVIGFQYVQTP